MGLWVGVFFNIFATAAFFQLFNIVFFPSLDVKKLNNSRSQSARIKMAVTKNWATITERICHSPLISLNQSPTKFVGLG